MSATAPQGAAAGPLTAAQAARRERVLRAALDLAAEGGYDAVQMRTVATRSEVALGTIYRYFSSKDHLLAAALVTWTNDLERRVARRPPKGRTPADRVGDVLERATQAMERQPMLTEAVILAISSPDPGAASCQGEVAGSMARVMDRAMPDDLDPGVRADVARVLNFVWYGALLGWVNGWSGTDSVADEIRNATRLLLDQFG
ncbi:MAG: TetR/AcrR family transcriptional regulator [Acidimicrobiales bacterium]|nr:TetR/AcrR family transcriptional regulator [Acidimicrobiales bacterium]